MTDEVAPSHRRGLADVVEQRGQARVELLPDPPYHGPEEEQLRQALADLYGPSFDEYAASGGGARFDKDDPAAAFSLLGLATCCRLRRPGCPRGTLEVMNAGTVVVRGEEELFARTAHLFATAGEISCAARDLHTFATARPHAPVPSDRKPSVRKLYRPAVLLDPSMAQHVRSLRGHADIRVTTDAGLRGFAPGPADARAHRVIHDEIRPFLENVTRGRRIPPARLEDRAAGGFRPRLRVRDRRLPAGTASDWADFPGSSEPPACTAPGGSGRRAAGRPCCRWSPTRAGR